MDPDSTQGATRAAPSASGPTPSPAALSSAPAGKPSLSQRPVREADACTLDNGGAFSSLGGSDAVSEAGNKARTNGTGALKAVPQVNAATSAAAPAPPSSRGMYPNNRIQRSTAQQPVQQPVSATPQARSGSSAEAPSASPPTAEAMTPAAKAGPSSQPQRPQHHPVPPVTRKGPGNGFPAPSHHHHHHHHHSHHAQPLPYPSDYHVASRPLMHAHHQHTQAYADPNAQAAAAAAYYQQYYYYQQQYQMYYSQQAAAAAAASAAAAAATGGTTAPPPSGVAGDAGMSNGSGTGSADGELSHRQNSASGSVGGRPRQAPQPSHSGSGGSLPFTPPPPSAAGSYNSQAMYPGYSYPPTQQQQQQQPPFPQGQGYGAPQPPSSSSSPPLSQQQRGPQRQPPDRYGQPYKGSSSNGYYLGMAPSEGADGTESGDDLMEGNPCGDGASEAANPSVRGTSSGAGGEGDGASHKDSPPQRRHQRQSGEQARSDDGASSENNPAARAGGSGASTAADSPSGSTAAQPKPKASKGQRPTPKQTLKKQPRNQQLSAGGAEANEMVATHSRSGSYSTPRLAPAMPASEARSGTPPRESSTGKPTSEATTGSPGTALAITTTNSEHADLLSGDFHSAIGTEASSSPDGTENLAVDSPAAGDTTVTPQSRLAGRPQRSSSGFLRSSVPVKGAGMTGSFNSLINGAVVGKAAHMSDSPLLHASATGSAEGQASTFPKTHPSGNDDDGDDDGAEAEGGAKQPPSSAATGTSAPVRCSIAALPVDANLDEDGEDAGPHGAGGDASVSPAPPPHVPSTGAPSPSPADANPPPLRGSLSHPVVSSRPNFHHHHHHHHALHHGGPPPGLGAMGRPTPFPGRRTPSGEGAMPPTGSPVYGSPNTMGPSASSFGDSSRGYTSPASAAAPAPLHGQLPYPANGHAPAPTTGTGAAATMVHASPTPGQPLPPPASPSLPHAGSRGAAPCTTRPASASASPAAATSSDTPTPTHKLALRRGVAGVGNRGGRGGAEALSPLQQPTSTTHPGRGDFPASPVTPAGLPGSTSSPHTSHMRVSSSVSGTRGNWTPPAGGSTVNTPQSLQAAGPAYQPAQQPPPQHPASQPPFAQQPQSQQQPQPQSFAARPHNRNNSVGKPSGNGNGGGPTGNQGGNANNNNNNNNSSGGGGGPQAAMSPFLYEHHTGAEVWVEEAELDFPFDPSTYGNYACLVNALSPEVPVAYEMQIPCDESACPPAAPQPTERCATPQKAANQMSSPKTFKSKRAVEASDETVATPEDEVEPKLSSEATEVFHHAEEAPARDGNGGPEGRPRSPSRSSCGGSSSEKDGQSSSNGNPSGFASVRPYQDFAGPYFTEPVLTLESIWQSFDVPFGCSVPLVQPAFLSKMRPPEDTVVYVPILSGFRVHFHECSAAHGKLQALRMLRGQFGDADMDQLSDGLLTWSASERPDNRNGVAEQVRELAQADEAYSTLLTATTADVDHQSWIAIMWQPVFCGGHSAKHSCGAFLAYYLLRAPHHLFLPYADRSHGAAMNSSWNSPVFRADRVVIAFDLWTFTRRYELGRRVEGAWRVRPCVQGGGGGGGPGAGSVSGRVPAAVGDGLGNENEEGGGSTGMGASPGANPPSAVGTRTHSAGRAATSSHLTDVGALDAQSALAAPHMPPPYVRLPIVGLVPNRCRSDVWMVASDIPLNGTHAGANGNAVGGGASGGNATGGGGGKTGVWPLRAPLFLLASALQLMAWNAVEESDRLQVLKRRKELEEEQAAAAAATAAAAAATTVPKVRLTLEDTESADEEVEAPPKRESALALLSRAVASTLATNKAFQTGAVPPADAKGATKGGPSMAPPLLPEALGEAAGKGDDTASSASSSSSVAGSVAAGGEDASEMPKKNITDAPHEKGGQAPAWRTPLAKRAYFKDGVELLSQAAQRYRMLREVAMLDCSEDVAAVSLAAAAARLSPGVSPSAAGQKGRGAVTTAGHAEEEGAPSSSPSQEAAPATGPQVVRRLMVGGTNRELCETTGDVIVGLLDFYQWAQYDTALVDFAERYCTV